MLDDEVVLDIETQKSFAEIGGRAGDFGKLGVSVAGAYSYRDDRYVAFEEHELPELEMLLRQARRIIGFNIRHFDYRVLQPAMPKLILRALPTLDLIEEPARVLGFRPKLNDLIRASLGLTKSGHGMDAPHRYREGKIEEIKRYCLDDVRLTKTLFEFGASKGHVLIERGIERRLEPIPINWKRFESESAVQAPLFR